MSLGRTTIAGNRMYGLPYPVDLEGQAANVVVMPCACGVRTSCINDDEGHRIGVISHQAVPEHRRWAERMGYGRQ